MLSELEFSFFIFICFKTIILTITFYETDKLAYFSTLIYHLLYLKACSFLLQHIIRQNFEILHKSPIF